LNEILRRQTLSNATWLAATRLITASGTMPECVFLILKRVRACQDPDNENADNADSPPVCLPPGTDSSRAGSAGPARIHVRPDSLRFLSCDRPGRRKSARECAAISHASSPLPVENLAESLAEGIVTGHPTMPQFQLDMAQIGASKTTSGRTQCTRLLEWQAEPAVTRRRLIAASLAAMSNLFGAAAKDKLSSAALTLLGFDPTSEMAPNDYIRGHIAIDIMSTFRRRGMTHVTAVVSSQAKRNWYGREGTIRKILCQGRGRRHRAAPSTNCRH
jgi:hypothetical protein